MLSAKFKLVRTMRSDNFRIPLQTVVAVGLAYVFGLLLATENVSWAVFSAIFVVQASAGATWGTAIGRTLGALVGSALGWVLALIALRLDLPVMATMMIGVALMSIVAAYRPALSYGLVTVAILTVAPAADLVEDAVEKVWAIAIGSLCAALAGTALLPVSIHRRAREDLESTAAALALWLEASTQSLLDEERGPIDLHHAQMDRALDDARATLWSAGEWFSTHNPAHSRAEDCRQSLLNLRYSVSILDRLGWSPLPAHVSAELRSPITNISDTARIMINRIGSQSLVAEMPDDLPDLNIELEQLRSSIAALSTGDKRLTKEAQEQLSAVGWAWATLTRQISRAARRQCGKIA